MLVLGTPDLAHEVLYAPPGIYLAGAANRRVLPVLPESTVLTLDGDEHRTRRRRLAPLFRGDALQAAAPLIRDIASREIERWPVGRPFAVLPRMRFLTLCIVARLVLGVEDRTAVKQIERHLSRALHPYSMLAGIEVLRRLGPASPQTAAERCRREFAEGLTEVLQTAGRASGAAPSRALELFGADELFALLLAGHETTATALAWAIGQLSYVPTVTDAMANEPRGADRPRLDAVIWETLRLRPPLIDIVRQLAQPVRLAGHDLPPGTLLLIPPPLIHRHGAGPDPDRFEPDRFLGHRPDPRTWLPFGGGTRRCLGASLAMLELREVLPQIVDRFELRPPRAGAERPRLHGTALVPARGAEVVLMARGATSDRPAGTLQAHDQRSRQCR